MSPCTRVLCIDDEPHALDALARTLRRKLDITTAVEPRAGLEILAHEGPFAVIVSDLRMPGMDGISFLEESRRISPHTVRMLLSGQADFDAALAAVNRGGIFKFLVKPCAPDVLQEAIEAAMEHYEANLPEMRPLQRPLPRLPRLPAPSGREAVMQFMVASHSARLRQEVINALAPIGYSEVVEVSDGRDVFTHLTPIIRGIIADCRLPGMNRPELVRTLRVHPLGSTIPLLLIGLPEDRDEILEALSLGADDILTYPFTPQTLQAKLNAALKTSRRLQKIGS